MIRQEFDEKDEVHELPNLLSEAESMVYELGVAADRVREQKMDRERK
jgi:IS4 transposase